MNGNLHFLAAFLLIIGQINHVQPSTSFNLFFKSRSKRFLNATLNGVCWMKLFFFFGEVSYNLGV